MPVHGSCCARRSVAVRSRQLSDGHFGQGGHVPFVGRYSSVIGVHWISARRSDERGRTHRCGGDWRSHRALPGGTVATVNSVVPAGSSAGCPVGDLPFVPSPAGRPVQDIARRRQMPESSPPASPGHQDVSFRRRGHRCGTDQATSSSCRARWGNAARKTARRNRENYVGAYGYRYAQPVGPFDNTAEISPVMG